MDAGEDIDAGINAPELCHQKTEDVFSGINGRPEVGSVGKQGADQKTDGHSGKKKRAEPVVIFAAAEKEICDCSSHIKEPEQVGNNKIFIEGNVVIEGNMHDVIWFADVLLKSGEPGQIYEAIGKNPDMAVFFDQPFHWNAPFRWIRTDRSDIFGAILSRL